MATKFGDKNPWPECSALLGSKVMQGSSGVNQGSNCLEMPYGHQIWWEESLTKVLCIAGVKDHVGVSWCQVGVKLRSKYPMATKFGGKNPDQNVMNHWGQRSRRGQLGQVGINLLSNVLWPSNFVGRNPDQIVMHCWGKRSCRGHPRSTRG